MNSSKNRIGTEFNGASAFRFDIGTENGFKLIIDYCKL